MVAPFDVTDIRIETDRLILRPWRQADLNDFYEYAKVDGVGQMAGWLPHESLETSQRILDSFIKEKKNFALELKENGKVIGSLGLEDRDAEELTGQGREIGYVLSKDYWGRGLMPEAVKAVIKYCFETLDFDWITCGHFFRNRQSYRVIEKCGFSYWKEILHRTRYGTIEQTRLYFLENSYKRNKQMTAPFDAVNTQIHTDRLILRPFQESDLADFHELSSMPEVADPCGWKCSETLDDSIERLKNYVQSNDTLAIIDRESGKLIGTFSFQARDWDKYPIDRSLKGRELGFDLNKNYWGRGLMPEAVNAAVDYCFAVLGYDFISCGHFMRNARSERVIQKCGFIFLFDTEHTMNTGVTEQIRTYIRYKEKSNV